MFKKKLKLKFLLVHPSWIYIEIMLSYVLVVYLLVLVNMNVIILIHTTYNSIKYYDITRRKSFSERLKKDVLYEKKRNS